MNYLILRLLKSLYIILPYELDGKPEHRFNLLNPLGWLLLICLCVYTGVLTIFTTGITVVREALINEVSAHKKPVHPIVNPRVVKKPHKPEPVVREGEDIRDFRARING